MTGVDVKKWDKINMIGGWIQSVIQLITEAIRAARQKKKKKVENWASQLDDKNIDNYHSSSGHGSSE